MLPEAQALLIVVQVLVVAKWIDQVTQDLTNGLSRV
jgi:hypothetical protein